MSEKQEQTGRRGWTAAIFALALLVGVYVAGYFTLGTYSEMIGMEVPLSPPGAAPVAVVHHAREFKWPMLIKMYVPMILLEGWWRGEDILVSSPIP